MACRQFGRLAGGDPGIIVDAGLGIAAAGLIAVAAWGSPGLIGSEAIAGPRGCWRCCPCSLGAPLVLRRRAPLLMWLAIWAAIALLSLLADNSVRGLAFTFVLFAAAYSLGAHASLRRAAAGLVLTAPVVAVISHQGGLGLAFSSQWRHGGRGIVVAAAAWRSGWLAFWSAPAGRPPRWPRGARRCSARPSRPRRPSGPGSPGNCTTSSPTTSAWSCCRPPGPGPRAGPDPATLEKIENSGRQALTETRRLLGVLRDQDEETGLAPQPGIGELPALAGSVRAAGLQVSLSIDGDHAALPPAVDVSAYRIVQEALTNVLKHAGPGPRRGDGRLRGRTR